jgi:aspartyl-tRNA(Asn)/glutamyl-tRNA(Gln) amidotransferase subunit B
MEQGSMRCDVNLSVRPEGSKVLGVRTEMKNMNSISAIERAIAYETARHIDAIENGTEELVQETRRWDDIKGMSFAMRNKETAGDYRYFPDPNVMPIFIDDEWYDRIEKSLPELPAVKKARYISELGLGEYDADILTQSRALCDCFEAAYEVSGLAKEAANWIISNCMNILNRKQLTADMLSINGTALGKLIKLVADGKVGHANAKKILEAMFDEDIDPASYAETNGYIVSNDTGKIEEIVRAVVASDPKTVSDYKGGKEKALMALFGRCMKDLRGNCDPQVLREILIKIVNES